MVPILAEVWNQSHYGHSSIFNSVVVKWALHLAIVFAVLSMVLVLAAASVLSMVLRERLVRPSRE